MLVWLSHYLAELWPGVASDSLFESVTKITFRATLAVIASFLVAIVLGPRMIAWLKARFREQISDRSPELQAMHLHKSATPTMGGLFLVAGLAVAMALLGNWDNVYLPVLIVNLLALAVLGAVDDLSKLSKKKGLRARTKFIAQLVLASCISCWMYWIHREFPGGLDLHLPLIQQAVPLGIAFIPLTALVIVGSSNAVNLTDGLDGLAGGCLMIAGGAMGAIVYAAGHSELSAYLSISHIPQASEAVIVAGALVGGTLGFLWFNCQPAQVFMGDTGSLSLGGTLGLLAVIARQEFLLFVIGGVFVAETISVVIQVASFRWTGRRVFRCAPLHHHFQFLGWSESKIVSRFWIVAILCAMAGLAAVRLYPQHESSRLDVAARDPLHNDLRELSSSERVH